MPTTAAYPRVEDVANQEAKGAPAPRGALWESGGPSLLRERRQSPLGGSEAGLVSYLKSNAVNGLDPALSLYTKGASGCTFRAMPRMTRLARSLPLLLTLVSLIAAVCAGWSWDG